MKSYFKLKILFYIFILSIIPLFSEEKPKINIAERVLLEDFETFQISKEGFKIQANTSYLPDVRISEAFTSPDLISNHSLLIRLSRELNGVPLNIYFPKPYILEDYIIELEFNIYSNMANGEIFIHLVDTHFQNHTIEIGKLNFDGWKNFRLPIGNKITQRDYVLGKPRFTKLVGISINPNWKESKTKEDMIAIDDIFMVKRKKYDLPQEGLQKFH